MSTDTTALQESLTRALCGGAIPDDLPCAGYNLLDTLPCEAHRPYIEATLPIVQAEVRKAKAEALREAALQYGPGQLTGMFSRDGYTRAWLHARATEYETGAEHE